MLKNVKTVQVMTSEGIVTHMRDSISDNIWQYRATSAYTQGALAELNVSEDFTKFSTDEVMRFLTLVLKLRNAEDEDILYITIEKFTGEIIEL